MSRYRSSCRPTCRSDSAARSLATVGGRPEIRPRWVTNSVAAKHLGLALGRREEAEQDLDQRGLSRAVRADQPGDAGGDRDGKTVERGHAARVDLGQRGGLDDGARLDWADRK